MKKEVKNIEEITVKIPQKEMGQLPAIKSKLDPTKDTIKIVPDDTTPMNEDESMEPEVTVNDTNPIEQESVDGKPEKQLKKYVGYSDETPMQNEACTSCGWNKGEGICGIVDGNIGENSWCRLWGTSVFANQEQQAPEEEVNQGMTEDYNIYAVCTKSVGREDNEKYEKCVKDLKNKKGYKLGESKNPIMTKNELVEFIQNKKRVVVETFKVKDLLKK